MQSALLPYMNKYTQALMEFEIFEMDFYVKWRRNFLEIEEIADLPPILANLLRDDIMINIEGINLNNQSPTHWTDIVPSTNLSQRHGNLVLLSSIPPEIVCESVTAIYIDNLNEEDDENMEPPVFLPNIAIVNFPSALVYSKQY